MYVWGLSTRYKGQEEASHGAGSSIRARLLDAISNREVGIAATVVFMTYFSFGVFEPLMEGVFKMTLGLSPAEVGSMNLFQAGIPVVMANWIGRKCQT